jgi:hypothetical protein
MSYLVSYYYPFVILGEERGIRTLDAYYYT